MFYRLSLRRRGVKSSGAGLTPRSGTLPGMTLPVPYQQIDLEGYARELAARDRPVTGYLGEPPHLLWVA